MILLSPETRCFIQEHLSDDLNVLLLQAHKYPNVAVREAVAQIQARQKAKYKLPSWFANQDVIFPPLISVEQSSSEITAKFKASIISVAQNSERGEKIALDLTGGMGVDVQHLSTLFRQVHYFEKNIDLAALTEYNLRILGIQHVTFHQGDSIDFLYETATHFSWIYLDPARRGDAQTKVVKLEDCEPNILKVRDLIFEKSENVLLKASPLLDIERAVGQLVHVSDVYAVAVENEMKELLFVLRKNQTQAPILHAVNLLKNGEQSVFSFQKSEDMDAKIEMGSPTRYLYEPNAAILKTGAFRLIAQRFGLVKLHPNSHLYASDTLRGDFPGRVFEIQAVTKLDKQAVKSLLPEAKANITTRNFPLTVQQIREKLGLKDGGENYLFATTDIFNKKIVIITSKIRLNK